MEIGQLVFDLIIEALIAIARLGTFSGRMLYAVLGLAPAREIMFLTGSGLWVLIGALAWAWLR
ncbi:hypothetical protein BRADO3761 [Bradyrhizobium sp. ORS 278]|uniref:hypothetical protein n=1 Tax=Bradyrhizobium sp. (strain ORS 278) TaxID=114615 RepID=UPI0001508448|nr:hypothetical protein [Bradyrhizobium sp. ORS 278]CAL77531.1 hypothetical protein BRADO3761 [Bradyrhizobium sp. ORS 278]